ncbi:MAG: chemotaxis protein CheW [Candidatus Sericytochromatia bacterium]
MIKTEDDEILLKRAKELSKDISVAQKDLVTESKEFFSFVVNNIKYALDKSYIVELHPDVSPKKVPFTPNYIKGIVNIRGEILSVTDLSAFFGNKPIESKELYQMIRLKSNKIEFGIVVDNIVNVIQLKPNDVHPFAISGNSTFEKFVRGVTKDMIHILNIELLFSDSNIIVDEVIS